MKILLLCIALLSCVACSVTATHPDEVTYLPGLDFPLNYKHYSGYLNTTKGRYLHYWFVESQRSPSKDPLLLWLNGGPGCSSLDGFFTELGPLRVTDDGKKLYNNTYAWNTVANVLFLETPAGVGFSYADNEDYATNDDATSYENYIALQHFFEKFPEFKKNDFYATGESYGGIYVPTLAVRILTGPAKINLKGFAIGNGYLDVDMLSNSVVFFAYFHGLIHPKLWRNLTRYCCEGTASRETCNFAGNISKNCNNTDHSLTYDPICLDSSNVRRWLNQPAVLKALHIPSHVQDWDMCSRAVEKRYYQQYNTMKPQILQLINSGKLRGLIYNGDVDMSCNFLGDTWFSYDLGLKVIKEYSPWKFNNQVAGFVTEFDKLTFMTVKGSGHMVPQDTPGPALKMIDCFLSNKPFY
ncbi:lysosomal protective protein [Nephila pilipes]|uniref:Lysosomal protective protein n=1 Tax=Nephila pilipes TaxID=299642 RepID=A0A8X6N5D1_NEPPI|nr:lysosomal protective protein [Nephila pilipes]